MYTNNRNAVNIVPSRYTGLAVAVRMERVHWATRLFSIYQALVCTLKIGISRHTVSLSYIIRENSVRDYTSKVTMHPMLYIDTKVQLCTQPVHLYFRHDAPVHNYRYNARIVYWSTMQWTLPQSIIHLTKRTNPMLRVNWMDFYLYDVL